MKSDSSENALLIVSIIAVIVAGIALLLQVNNVYALGKVLLAPADDQGTATVSITQNIKIDFTYDTIDWGAGWVPTGSGQAVLDTLAGTSVNWTNGAGGPSPVTAGFVVENTGNIPVELSLALENSMNSWLPPSGTSATLEYTVRNCYSSGGISGPNADCTAAGAEDDTAAACTRGSGLNGLGVLQPIKVNPAYDLVCNPYNSANNADEVRIDLRLIIPENMPPTTGAAVNHIIADIVANSVPG